MVVVAVVVTAGGEERLRPTNVAPSGVPVLESGFLPSLTSPTAAWGVDGCRWCRHSRARNGDMCDNDFDFILAPFFHVAAALALDHPARVDVLYVVTMVIGC